MVSKWKIQKKLVNVLSIVQIYSDLTMLTTESPIAQKMKFSIMDFFSKCAVRIWSHLLKKSLMENIIFLVRTRKTNTRKRCETCSNLMIKTTSEQRCSDAFIANFEYISHAFLLLNLKTQMFSGSGVSFLLIILHNNSVH